MPLRSLFSFTSFTMADVKKVAPEGGRVFIGKAWVNTAGTDANYPGTKFLSIRIDRGLEVTLTEKDNLLLWPNTSRREGKKDAHYNVSVGAVQAQEREDGAAVEIAAAELLTPEEAASLGV